MKHIKLIILAILLNSCNNLPKENLKNITTIKGCHSDYNREIFLYVIDSCEYIGYINATNNDFLTHKGNCKHCKISK